VSKYAPQSDNNNVQRYTAFLSKATGLNPYDVINPKDTTLMTNLVIGIITKENGSNPYSRAQIQEAVSRSVAYADRGFRHFEINIKAHTEEVENKTRKAIPLPSSKEASSKAEKAKPSALPEKVLPKADKAKGSGPLGVQVPGVDDVATGFIIPMSGRFSSGSSDKRTVTLQDGRTKTSGHRGIDIAAPSGTPVYAAHSGKVIRASNTDPKGYGNNVVIQGDDRYYSWYAHLSAFRTKVGERLLRGSLLGLSGGAKGDPGAGGSTGPHLHFAISKAFNGKDSGFIPPEQFLVGLPKESERRDLESKGISVIVLSSADSVRPNTEAQYLRQGTKVKVLRI
jgi:murein DD-endopeptidase MepM/ murein hydrolase activator NlpD